MRAESNENLIKQLRNSKIFPNRKDDFRILSVEELNSLSFFSEIGHRSILTDFAILCGGIIESDGSLPNYCTSVGLHKNRNRCGSYYVLPDNKTNRILSCVGDKSYTVPQSSCGVRPSILFPTSKLTEDDYSEVSRKGIPIVSFGEYPQFVANNEEEILDAIENRKVSLTGCEYYLPGAGTIKEVEYKGKRYLPCPCKNSCVLSNSKSYSSLDTVIVEVAPVRYLVDTKQELLLSEKILFAGVSFSDSNKVRYNGSNLQNYLQNTFTKEILQHVSDSKSEEFDPYLENPYHFNYSKVKEEDIIRGMIESNVSVFLHGKSSDGKSARIKAIDPDCVVLYMGNATPESLNGLVVYNEVSGKCVSIPPTWYKKIMKKSEQEPNKIHLVFFDELTNANPTLQGMAFNIVLNGEINGKWKLPENVRIVAAGNELTDSLSAFEFAEPLYNRFAHVYIHTDVANWTKWATSCEKEQERMDYVKPTKPHTIHPAIMAYLAYKAEIGEDTLRVEFNGITPNPDPRKWEFASNVLYTTNQPEMLRSLVGRNVCEDFITFTKTMNSKTLEVIERRYKDANIVEYADAFQYKK